MVVANRELRLGRLFQNQHIFMPKLSQGLFAAAVLLSNGLYQTVDKVFASFAGDLVLLRILEEGGFDVLGRTPGDLAVPAADF